MRLIVLTGAILVCFLIICGAGSAEKIPGMNGTSGKTWNGTWESAYYTLYILQNGSTIEGRFEPYNISEIDPGLLQGTLSADGRTFSGRWIETGSLSLVLADDKMSYSGTGTVRPNASPDDPGAYTTNGTRMESAFDPQSAWNGTWNTKRTLNSLTQNGTRVSGSYTPLPGTEDDPGLVEGTVSDDGKTLSGSWTEFGNFSFRISDNGKYWNGTYDLAQNTSAGSDTWNATKVQ